MTNPDFIVVTTTHEAEEPARDLAARVVRERLAACAQVYPVDSVYWWDGDVRAEPEYRIDFKTRADLADRLTAYVEQHHSYETPEVVAVPVTGGSAAYLDWVATETAR
ncbi:divalent-cation tolerance protein CutA [Peterkaempfera bronchialis]|uniref:Divalent-cation tolerance protein CutA n=1 Tax=Peterkaempfera bronchialis TaxID=2126346 RepID=A0A345SUE0_9ACTN|nr:divalent-cation tolerance protein CutA [Peterkaempfera bronchialis]AXI77345.1 divalent-cation tolerance protein CutA [Peterkaempfera bronchialis]